MSFEHTLSTPEKKQIENILNEAETCFSPEDKIEDAIKILDVQSRQIWDDWDDAVANGIIIEDSYETRDLEPEIKPLNFEDSSISENSANEKPSKTLRKIKNKYNMHNIDSSDEESYLISHNDNEISKLNHKNSSKAFNRLMSTSTEMEEPYVPKNTRISRTSIRNEHTFSRNNTTMKTKNTSSKMSFADIHERNEYNKLRRENIEYNEQIRLLRNQLEKVNQDNENLRNSLNQSKIERSKQKAKLQFLKHEKYPL